MAEKSKTREIVEKGAWWGLAAIAILGLVHVIGVVADKVVPPINLGGAGT